MPAINEDGPVRVAVNVRKDGGAGGPPAVAATVRPKGPSMLDALANSRRVVPDVPPPPPQLFNPVFPKPPPSDDSGSGSYSGDEGDDFSDESGSEDSRGFRGMEEDAERTKAMKSECLQKLHRYAQQGHPVPEHLGMRSSLEELQGECDRIKRGIDTQNAIQFQRRMLVTFVTGIEYANGAFDPLGNMGLVTPQLQGWSRNVMAEIDSFDSVFEELYEKYRNRVAMPPELQLFLALAMSAVACHMQNAGATMFKPSTAQARPPPPPPQQAPTPPPAPAPALQKTPAAPPRARPGTTRLDAETLTRSAPDPEPYIMQGPPGGLGVLAAPAPVPMGATGLGPALTAIAVPPGSAHDLLNPPELTVPPREPLGTITELPPSPVPSRTKKRAPPRKKRDGADSEAGIEL